MSAITPTTPSVQKPNQTDSFNSSFGSSLSLNNNASHNNSDSSTEFNVSPSSEFSNTPLTNADLNAKNKKPRRIKNEAQQLRIPFEQSDSKPELDFYSNTDNACDFVNDDELALTVETLTPFQKQVILREFCEIYYVSPEKPKKSATNVRSPKKMKLKASVDLKLVDRPISGKNFEGEEIIIEDDDEIGENLETVDENDKSSSKSRSNSSPVSSQASMANKSEQDPDDTIFMDTESEQYYYENEPTSKIMNAKTSTAQVAKAH